MRENNTKKNAEVQTEPKWAKKTVHTNEIMNRRTHRSNTKWTQMNRLKRLLSKQQPSKLLNYCKKEGGKKVLKDFKQTHRVASGRPNAVTIQAHLTTLLLWKPIPKLRQQTQSTHKCVTWGLPQKANKVSLPNQAIGMPITQSPSQPIHQPPFRDPS